MSKKIWFTAILLTLMVSLAACSGLSTTRSNTQAGAAASAGSLSTQQKLGVGILSLKDSSLDVTSSQAGELLPLWRAVKNLSGDDNTAPDEMTALYQQIQDALTSEQVQAIAAYSVTQSDLNSTLQQNQSGPAAGAASASAAQSQLPAGGPGDVGGGMPAGEMMMGAADAAGGSTTQTSSQALSGASAGSTQELNVMVADSVVAMLEQYASA